MHKPWFKPADPVKKNAHVAIIGGGICGVTLTHHLSNAGYNVTLVDQQNQILSAASGNPAAILDPYISIGESYEKSFHLEAYRYALQFYGSFGPDVFKPNTLVKLATNAQQKKRFREIAKQYDASILYFDKDRLIFPGSGLVTPNEMTGHFPNPECHLKNVNVNRLTKSHTGDWSIFCDKGTHLLDAEVVILSNSFGVNEITQSSHLKLDKRAGQISYLRTNRNVENIYCSDGYLTPPVNSPIGEVNIIGATFEKNNSLDISDIAHKENLQQTPVELGDIEVLGGRRGIRAMSKDHLPVAGPAPIYDEYLDAYSEIHHGPLHKKFPSAPYHKNLFIAAGLGARGFVTAPLIAKYLTAILSGDHYPFDEAICHALHPARFIMRNLSKK